MWHLLFCEAAYFCLVQFLLSPALEVKGGSQVRSETGTYAPVSTSKEGCRRDYDSDSNESAPGASTPGASVPGASGEAGCANAGDATRLPSNEPALPQAVHSTSSSLSRETWEGRERKKQIRILEIQNHVISVLGLQRRPNVPTNNLTKAQLDRFEVLWKMAEQNSSRTLVPHQFLKRYQALMPVCSGPRNSDMSWEDGNAYRLFFNVEPTEGSRNRQIKVSSATLKLKKKPFLIEGQIQETTTQSQESRRTDLGPENDVIKLLIFAYNRTVRRNRNDAKTLVKNMTIRRGSGGSWVRVNIKGLVEDWLRRPNRNFGLQLVLKDNKNQKLDPFQVFEGLICNSNQSSSASVRLPLAALEESLGQDLDDTIQLDPDISSPYLDMVSTEVPISRNIRHQRDLSYFKGPTCVMEKMFVSLEELGYSDRIIQPKGFETGFCKGSCTFDTIFSHIISIDTSISENQISEHKCCGVTKVKPLSLLHYNNMGKLSITVIDDVIVTECGCRP